MNNTVSPKQVQAITREIDEIMASVKVKAENAGSAFFGKMKNLWEDTQAVEFAKSIGNQIEGSIQQLAQGGNGLKDGVVDVANFYARRAGKPLMNAPHSTFNGAINPNVVSDTFDGDEYGFKDASAVGALVGEVAELTKSYEKLGQEAASRLASINAFGNPDIKAKLLSSANSVSQGLAFAGKAIERTAQERISKAAKDYDIGDVSAFFKNKITDGISQAGESFATAVGGAIGGVAGAADLAKTAVKDPALFKDSFTYAVTGKDNRGIMDDKK